ncbi:adaptin region [Oesophagostomum dentatum]|uniref:Coatomer subunit beta n=1 Tax=Oesophagostomum dentatum TaxID=61180 RepID=A0A0B1TQC3_OESDE|nr:adaptin region [Oesophagostomum dentatum]
MSSGELPCYTLIHVPTDADLPNEAQLKEKFEKGTDKEKTEALKKLIYMIQNGEKIGQGMLMYVIRFLLPSSDHTLKKTLLIFWEVVPKTNAQGKLLQEMILVCDAYRKDLQHPNEFVRGSTLRFLCKLKEPELLEPLMPSIIGCLEHRHSYVRRNAVCAIFTIYRNFEFLIPDAPELVSNFLEGEQDASCKRNAFMMLLHVDQARALDYLSGCIDQVAQFGDILQLIIVELIYKVCHANPAERSRFIRCVYNLLQSSSAAVRYEAAGTLVTLSAAPAAIKAAAQAYIDLIVKESDNNVKLIVLDRLMDLRQTPSHEKVLQELVMDILRVLSSPGLDVRQKTLNLALDLVSSRNVGDMVMFLKKEIAKSTSEPAEEAGRYRQALVKTLHSATIKFPDVAPSIVPVLMEFLSDENEVAAQYVLLFVREAVHKLPHLKETILHSLQEGLPTIRKPKVFMAALWILGTYCENDAAVLSVLRLIKNSLGELPIVESEMRQMEGEETPQEESTEKKATAKQLVTADGTYATQSALSATTKTVAKEKPPLRHVSCKRRFCLILLILQFLLDGDFFLGASLATVLNKLAEQFTKNNGAGSQRANRFRGECMFILASIINLGKSGLAKQNITEDDLDRMGTTIKLLAQGCSEFDDIFVEKCKDSLELMLASRHQDKTDEFSMKKKNIVEVDKTIMFTQLSARADASIGENLFDLSLSQALGTAPKTQKFDFSSSKLGKVIQLAGFSDPVYAEAYVSVNQYDIVLDVLIVNQTADTLQNVSLELSTVGDLKLVDKPTPITLAPADFANIKVILLLVSFSVYGSFIMNSLNDYAHRKFWAFLLTINYC